MKTIQIKNLSNEVLREVELPEAIFAYPFKEHLVHTAVEAWRAAQRAGSHKVKVRSEVRGSGRKLWRQKGTGRARMGSIRSPIWRTGGIVHGPKPRDYTMGVSVREKKVALCSALSRKLADGGLVVLDSLERDSHKTGELTRDLAALGVPEKTVLVDVGENPNLDRASRNIPRVDTIHVRDLNVYEVVNRDHVVLSADAVEALIGMLDGVRRRAVQDGEQEEASA